MAGDGLGKHIDENGPYYRLKLCINDINDIGPYGLLVVVLVVLVVLSSRMEHYAVATWT